MSSSPGGVAPFTGFRWPVGEWVEVDSLEPCRGGIRVALAEECDRHAAHHEHCRICADVCRRCKAACDEVLAF